MKFAMALPTKGPLSTPEHLPKLSEEAEKLNFYSLCLSDHVVIPDVIDSKYPYAEKGGAPKKFFAGDYLEQLTTLAFVAGKTSKINLMTCIMVLPYRNPLLAAKMLANIDYISNGRLIVGAGAGWMKEESDVLGSTSFEDRGKVVEEYVNIFKEVWTAELASFNGNYTSFSGIKLSPKPSQTPHPPILVGGESNAALKRAAKVGDGWYPEQFPRVDSIDMLTDIINRLDTYCKENGRNVKDLQIGFNARTWSVSSGNYDSSSAIGDYGFLEGTSDKIVDDIRQCESLGVNFISFNFQGHSSFQDPISSTLEDTLSRMNLFSEKIMSQF